MRGEKEEEAYKKAKKKEKSEGYKHLLWPGMMTNIYQNIIIRAIILWANQVIILL